MLLGRQGIISAFETGDWTINKDLKDLTIGTNSVDVTLGDSIYRTVVGAGGLIDPEGEYLDLTRYYKFLNLSEDGGWYMLDPGEFILASVQEKIDCSIPQMGCRWSQHYDGRSTMARLGIQSHMTAGFGDLGFKGAFTLEIHNCAPFSVILRPGMRIGQIYFMPVIKVCADTGLYEGYDQGDCKPQLPRLGKDRF